MHTCNIYNATLLYIRIFTYIYIYIYIYIRVVRKPCGVCVTKQNVNVQGLVYHILHPIPSCSTLRFAKHMKRSTFIYRACDSTAHRAYQTRNRYTDTLLFFFQEALAQ